MTDEPTCGKGLAAHAPLPAAIADLTAAVAGILEQHALALNLADDASLAELDAYLDLVRRHRETAGALHDTSARMAGCRELPMGRHDPDAMAAPGQRDAFAGSSRGKRPCSSSSPSVCGRPDDASRDVGRRSAVRRAAGRLRFGSEGTVAHHRLRFLHER